MSDGQGRGTHMGWSYKRMELRSDNRMYIVDVQSPIDKTTTDAVEFTPALIVDSKVIVDANCGWTSVNPRACIGQSEKGEVLMLVIEGRLVGYSLGTGVVECADILQRHKCAQAMNLDGGTSAILWYDGEYVTRCSNRACPEGRTLPNAFVYTGNQ
jgi:exopolysaccharide biosynthesis protein